MKNDVVSMNNVRPAAPQKPQKPVIVSTNTTHPAPVHHPEPGKRTSAKDPIFMGVKAEPKTAPASEPEQADESKRPGRPKKAK